MLRPRLSQNEDEMGLTERDFKKSNKKPENVGSCH
jgi:hypothetical protein